MQQATTAIDQPGISAIKTTTGDMATAIADTAKRIVIDAPLVSGSFSLQGARIDDVVLTDYRETQEVESENIQFLKKISGNNSFFAEFGWAVSDTQQPMPGADTLWTASGDVLSPAKPVTLTWNNDNGLVFTRNIAINDDYIITFDDVITSSLDTALTVFPYGLVRRHGTPQPVASTFFMKERLASLMKR